MDKKQPKDEKQKPARTALDEKRDDAPAGSNVAKSTTGVLAKVVDQTLRVGSTPISTSIRAGAADPSDITDELEKGGPAFGSFVSAVGLAVAESQAKLDATLAATAEALSKQEINVIAVYEQQIKDDDGQMDKGNIQMQKLPLINFLMPTAYQWSRVYLEADMKVQEFNAKSGFNIQQKAEQGGFYGGLSFGAGGFGASIGGGYSNSFSTATGENTFGTDTAVGSIHMEATLEPRGDIRVPQPFVLQKGPRLQLSASGASDISDGATPPNVIGRQVTLTATLLKANGDANSGKALAVRLDQPTVNFSTNPLDSTTDSTGKLQIILKREGAAFQVGTTVQVQVRVWFGLVSEVIIVSI
jgi:hypothetical protein